MYSPLDNVFRHLRWFAALVPILSLSAQEVAEPSDEIDDEDVITLSPFTVDAEDMQGYTATSTFL